MQMAIPLYLTTIEQDIFDTFRYLPHAVAVGVGFVTVAAAWKNQQMIKKQKRLEHAHAVPGTQLLLWFLVAVYFAMMLSITLFSREPGSRTGVDVKLFETWGNQRLPDRYFVENILLFLPFGVLLPAAAQYFYCRSCSSSWYGCFSGVCVPFRIPCMGNNYFRKISGSYCYISSYYPECNTSKR